MSRIAHLVLAAVVFALAGSGAGASVRTLSHDEPGVTHGVVVGDVTARTAVLWARADREGTLKVHLSGGKHHGVARLETHAEDDYTGQVLLTGLRPDTTYRYRVGSERGTFETAPAADDRARVRLAFGGDVAGQNVCRDTREGFPIMETIRAGRPDVFVGLGDMIYADNACNALGMYGNAQVPGPGPAPDLATFWAHWRYNRADEASQRLLREHELRGRLGRPRGRERLRAAERHPLDAAVHARRAPAPDWARGVPRLHADRDRGEHAQAAVSLVALGQASGAVRARYTAVPGRERRLRQPRPLEDDARARAADLAEGGPGGLGRHLESDRLERPDVDSDRVPGQRRTGRLGQLRPDDRLRAGAARHPRVHGAEPVREQPGLRGLRAGDRAPERWHLSQPRCGSNAEAGSAHLLRAGRYDLGASEALLQLRDTRGRAERRADRRDRQHGGQHAVLAHAHAAIDVLGEGGSAALPKVVLGRARSRLNRLSATRRRHEGDEGARFVVERLAGDAAAIVDVVGGDEDVVGVDELVQVAHLAVLPQVRVAVAVDVAGAADDLPPLVESPRVAVVVQRGCERAEVVDAVALCPQESVGAENPSVGLREVGEADDVTAPVDRVGRVPGEAAQVADVDHLAVVPEHGMPGGEPADCLIADAGDADDLTAVVDRGRRAGGVTREQRQLPHPVAGSPGDRAELQDLRRHARRVVHGVLGPADDPVAVVRAGGEAVRAAECR